MSAESHMDWLQMKHFQLEKQLHDAYIHHDNRDLQRLKKEKLKIKDEMEFQNK